MPDMLVRLYELPDHSGLIKDLAAAGVEIRRALAPETHIVTAWVRKHFGDSWASECARAMNNTPVSCFLAVEGGKLLGFGCHEATCRDFFGSLRRGRRHKSAPRGCPSPGLPSRRLFDKARRGTSRGGGRRLPRNPRLRC